MAADIYAPHSCLVSLDCLAWPLTDRAFLDAAGTWKACKYVTTRREHRINALIETDFAFVVWSLFLAWRFVLLC